MKNLVGSTVLLFSLAISPAFAIPIVVDAAANSSSGGVGASTGLVLAAGETFSVSVDPTDIWSAGPLPRWSNADGLIADLFATGSDESGQAAGTLIGTSFSNHSQSGLSAPFGALVGSIAGNYFLIGTSFSGPALAAGELLLHYWDSNARRQRRLHHCRCVARRHDADPGARHAAADRARPDCDQPAVRTSTVKNPSARYCSQMERA